MWSGGCWPEWRCRRSSAGCGSAWAPGPRRRRSPVWCWRSGAAGCSPDHFGGCAGVWTHRRTRGPASAVEVCPCRGAEDLDELLILGDPALHLGRVATVALDGTVDAADGFAEAAAV